MCIVDNLTNSLDELNLVAPFNLPLHNLSSSLKKRIFNNYYCCFGYDFTYDYELNVLPNLLFYLELP